MAMWLRQSTASQEIQLGPFVDDTDGKTAETGLTIANTDIKLFKHGATSQVSKNSGGGTHMANGYYSAVLDATDTNTLGILEVTVNVAGALGVRREFMVVPAMIFDSMILGTDRLDTNVTHVNDTAQTAGDIPAKTNNLPAAPAATGDCITAAGVRSAVGLASANLDTQLDALPTASENASAVWGAGDRTLTALDEDSTTLDLDATIRGAVGLAAANLDTQLDALPTAAENASAVWGAGTRSLTVLDEDSTTLDLDATIRGAVGLGSANLDTQLDALPTAAENADAVWDEDATAHQTQGTFGQAIGDPGADTDSIWGLANTNLNATISSRASQASVDDLPTNAELAAALDPLPTAAENASAVWGAGARTLTALDEDNTTVDLDATIRAAVGLGSANLDTQIGDLPTNSELTTALSPVDTKVDELHKFRGLDGSNPWTVEETEESAGGITLGFTGDGETSSTVTRQP